MTRLFRVILLAAALLGLSAPTTASADYGSGVLGSWQNLTHGVSGDLSTADVVVVGDSITTGCHSYLAKYLPGVKIAVGYWSGRPTKPAVDWTLSLSRKPPVLVMASGSNDIMNPPAFWPQVDRLKASLPTTTKLLWVNIYAARPAYSGDQKNSAWVNNQLERRLPKEQIIDWWGQLYWTYDRGITPASKLRDGIHPNIPGCELWGFAVAGSVKEALA